MSRSGSTVGASWPTAPKASVTDEPLDAYVNRPLAGLLVRAVSETSVSPNQLTFVSACLGTAAGACFAWSPRMPQLAAVGALSLFLSMVFDCSDGQLARIRGGGSVLGRILDGYADYWVAFSVHLGMLIAAGQTGVVLFGHPLNGFERFLLFLAAGVSMGVNAGRFDYYKQRFLAYTGAAREPETPEHYFAEAERSHWALVKVLLRLFGAYVRVQQGPEFHATAALARETAQDPVKRARFIERNAALVRLWGFSGPTMHNAAICATACLVPLFPAAFTGYTLYALVAVNVYCFALVFFQRRARRGE